MPVPTTKPAPTDAATSSLDAWTRYVADAWWRAVATADTLRQRADNMREHEAAGMPPLLHFESEQIADAHAFEPPSNYRLLRVTRCGTDHLEQHVRHGAAPVIVIDPRAGHGPGIGGLKRDSEVGMALLEGHPVYFVVFDPAPVEGQTLGAVIRALARFIDTVAGRHPGTPPIVYGNCQGGWAATLALAHCEHRAGLAVLNGSPLSQWPTLLTLAMFPILCFMYVRLAIAEERMAQRDCGAEWERYAARTPRWIPRWRPTPNSGAPG